MKSFSIFLILIFILSSCKSSKQADVVQDISKVYPLLQRNNALMYSKEWENVHNIYTRLIDHLRTTPADSKSSLELAELFMQEARITGEHGH
jgi:outer membrane protein assembly factor BamD (BamD/ComL family)